MARKKGVELFELLADRSTPLNAGLVKVPPVQPPECLPVAPVPSPAAVSAPQPIPLARSTYAGRELVIGVDMAFVVFVAVVAGLISAYKIGHDRGAAEEADRAAVEQARTLSPDDVAPYTGIEGRNPAEPLHLSGQEYVLRLRSTRGHEEEELRKLRVDQAFAAGVVKAGAADLPEAVCLIYDNGKVYSLAVGLFKDRGEAGLARLRELFKDRDGPPSSGAKPYAGCAVDQTGQLGELLQE